MTKSDKFDLILSCAKKQQLDEADIGLISELSIDNGIKKTKAVRSTVEAVTEAVNRSENKNG